jgi:hypothetical protein
MEHEATLYLAFHPDQADGVQEYPLGYDEGMDAQSLIDGLSAITSYDFAVTVEEIEAGAKVDWLADSTLVAGRQDLDLPGTYEFDDAAHFDYFMLDSLAKTLQDNLGYEAIYYTMAGGAEIDLPDSGIQVPADAPYEYGVTGREIGPALR